MMIPSDGFSAPASDSAVETAPRPSSAPWVIAVLAVASGGLAVALVLALMATGGDAPPSTNASTTASGSDVEVLDLMSIVDGDIIVQAHGDGTSTVLVDTTLDLVCAVSFGSTQALGSLATDSDMAGAGHANHHPLLVGLEENTDYFYRLQGVAADGTLYASDLRRFTNGAVTAAAPAENLALGASVAEVSSQFSSGFSANLAIDGDRATEWSSAGDGDDVFIVLDLGQTAELVGLGFRTREMSNGTSITTLFTVSIDGGPALGPFEAGPGLAVAEFEATGRTVRVDVVTSSGGNTGAIEIEVYGSPAGGTS
jgi:hypothetical protein